MDDFRPERESIPLPENAEVTNGATENGANRNGASATFFADKSSDAVANDAPDTPNFSAISAANDAQNTARAVEISSSEKPLEAPTETPLRDASSVALADASELLSQQILGETPLLPPRSPLGARIVSSVARHHGLLLALCALLLWAAMTLRLPDSNGGLRPGMRVAHDVIAPRATTVLDRETTQERREEVAALVTPEYDSDASAQSKSLANLNLLLRTIRQQAALEAQNVRIKTASANAKIAVDSPSNRTSSTRSRGASRRNAASNASPENIEHARLQVESSRRVARLNVTLQRRGLSPLPKNIATRAFAVSAAHWPLLEIVARESARAAYFYEGRVQQIRSDADVDLVLAARRMKAQLDGNFSQSSVSNSNETSEGTAHQISSTRLRAAQAAGARAAAVLSNDEKSFALALAKIVARVPNLVVNARKTERARREARNDVPAVYRNILAGSVLVEAGNVIDSEKWAQLQDLDLVAPRFDPLITMARFILCAILVGFAAVYVARSCPSVLSSPAALWLLTILPPLTVVLARLMLRVPYGETLISPLVAIGAMALTILLNARLGLLCGLMTSLLCAVMAREDSASFAAITTVALVGALLVSEIATWAQLARAILFLGITSAGLSAATGVMREIPLLEVAPVSAFSGGIGAIAVVIAAGLAVFLGRVLGITTHLSLLELASPDEPVLRRMQSEAPGTYTHSLMVAQLSEAGAKATGADALLCRVGGLYHDVGKLRRPHCFIENQSGVNVHDRLSAQLSALLIIAHVKDGLELARALRLPRPVHAIIEQHHGTDLVSYFYHRAQQTAAQAEQLGLTSSTQTSIDEALFRYRGPRPQSKEAAIVMLADAVEASSRALPDLTPEKLESHIKTMIYKRLHDGELADCELTMRDLGIVEKAFAHVLRGALHQRIEYPDPSRDQKNGRTVGDDNWTSEVLRDPQRNAPRDAPDENTRRRPIKTREISSHNTPRETAQNERGNEAKSRRNTRRASETRSAPMPKNAKPENAENVVLAPFSSTGSVTRFPTSRSPQKRGLGRLKQTRNVQKVNTNAADAFEFNGKTDGGNEQSNVAAQRDTTTKTAPSSETIILDDIARDAQSDQRFAQKNTEPRRQTPQKPRAEVSQLQRNENSKT